MITELERLAEIEHIIAHQTQQIEDLSDMVNRQWTAIDQLEKNLSHAKQRLENLEDSPEQGSITHEIPPHY